MGNHVTDPAPGQHPYEWRSEYETGIEEIDEQHRKLFGYINQFYDMLSINDHRATSDLLNSLFEYIRFHFSTEESYFEQFDYPNQEAHVERHDRFIEEVAAMKVRFDSGESFMSNELSAFLKDWLRKHILGDDQQYVKCFKENGLD